MRRPKATCASITVTNSPSESSRRRIWRLPSLMAVLAVAIRVAIIVAFPEGRDDLRIYSYFGGLLAHGLNPYLPPLDGLVSPQYANMTVLNLGIFATVFSLWDSPTALRVLFALVDGLIILTVGYSVRRPRAWRTAVMDFYTFNPLVLMALVVDPQDKVIVVWLTLMVIVGVEAGKGPTSLVWTTLLTLYRWLGAFFVLPVTLHFARTWRSLLAMLGLFGAAFALSHIPYWPANLFIYQSRAARALINPPIHDSPTMLLAALGLYDPRIVSVFILGTLVTLYSLYVWRRVTLVEVVVLSSFFTTMISPELPAGRIVMVSVPLFWLITVSRRRMVLLWIVTIAASLFMYPYLFASLRASLGIQDLFVYGSLSHMLLINLLPALLLVYYLVDKRRRRVPRTTLLPADWLLARAKSPAVMHAQTAQEPLQ